MLHLPVFNIDFLSGISTPRLEIAYSSTGQLLAASK